MARLYRKYTRFVWQEARLTANWTPSTPIALGTVGVYRQGRFVPISTLSDLGIEFEELKDETAENLKFSDQGEVTVHAKLQGSATIPGSTLGVEEAGFHVNFTSKHSALAHARDVLRHRIRDQVALEDHILNAFEAGRWERKWAVVTDVCAAKSTTVLIGKSANATVDLRAKGSLDAGDFSLADIDAQLVLSYSRDVQAECIATEELTPFFVTRGVKTRFNIPFEGVADMARVRSAEIMGVDVLDTLPEAAIRRAMGTLRPALHLDAVGPVEDDDDREG